MAAPREVSRSIADPHYALPWNAMVDLCAMEPLEKCTPVQRRAALVFWYQAEVNNGGHFQYIVNKRSFPHIEVVECLRTLGATHSAMVLASALEHLHGTHPAFPESPEAYLAVEEEFGLDSFDAMWGARGDEEVHNSLLAYLRSNESEFVSWRT